MPHGPHDKAFKMLLKEEGAAEALLRERLPGELVARFAGRPPMQVKRLTVDFEVVLVDLNAEPTRRLSSHPMLKGGLLGLKAAATPLPKLEGVLKKMLQSLSRDPSTRTLLLNYLVSVGDRNTLPILSRVAREQEKGPEDPMQTIKQYLLSQGRRQGLRQGLEKGVEKGVEKGIEKGRVMLRDNLRRLLTKRFKRVTLSVEQQLAAADAETLNRWFETAWTAKSLKAVFD